MIPYVVVMTVALAALLVAEWMQSRAGVWAVKPLAALTFVAAGVAMGGLATTFGTVMLAGLVLCLGGDVLLIPRARGAFLAGLVSFLLGHVAYAIAFVVRGLHAGATGAAAAGLALAALLVARWLLPHVEREMKGPVLAYTAVITTMVACAVGTFVAHGDPWLVAGAAGFYLSDLAVARDRFVAPGFVNRAWGLPLYFYSQLALASTLVAPGP